MFSTFIIFPRKALQPLQESTKIWKKRKRKQIWYYSVYSITLSILKNAASLDIFSYTIYISFVHTKHSTGRRGFLIVVDCILIRKHKLTQRKISKTWCGFEELQYFYQLNIQFQNDGMG